jgi:hypothetical protein
MTKVDVSQAAVERLATNLEKHEYISWAQGMEDGAAMIRALSAEVIELRANLPCGHPASLMLKSAETGEPLYCELCDAQSGRRDAENMEVQLRAELAAEKARVAQLERAVERKDAVLAGIADAAELFKMPDAAKLARETIAYTGQTTPETTGE